MPQVCRARYSHVCLALLLDLDLLVWRLCYRRSISRRCHKPAISSTTTGPRGAIFTHRWKWLTCRGIGGLSVLVNMLKTRQCLLGIRTFLSVTSRIWGFIMYILRKHLRTVRTGLNFKIHSMLDSRGVCMFMWHVFIAKSPHGSTEARVPTLCASSVH